MNDEVLRFELVPEPPAMKVGDRVDVITHDGVGRFVVTHVQPRDPTNADNMRVTFATAPMEEP